MKGLITGVTIFAVFIIAGIWILIYLLKKSVGSKHFDDTFLNKLDRVFGSRKINNKLKGYKTPKWM